MALAKAALARGDTVIGTVRGTHPQIDAKSGTLHVLTLDVTDPAAIDAAVAEALKLTDGALDVVVNNAGYGLLGAVEDAEDNALMHLFATDVFGPIRIIRAVLPALRQQGSGHIVNITSIAGRAPMAGAGLYSAAKFALEGLSASLSQEVAPLGIKVTAVAPGAFRTDFLAPSSIRHLEPGSDAYAATAGRSRAALDNMAGKQAGDPARGAEAILQLVDSPEPPLNLLLGTDALTRTRAKLETVTREIDAWESVTRGTDFPPA